MDAIAGESKFSCLIALVLHATFAGSGVHAQEITLEVRHRGVTFIALPAIQGNYYDMKIMDTRQAVEKMRKAVDFFEAKSSYNATVLESLKKNGHVRIIYDPDFPQSIVKRAGEARAGQVLAAFVSDQDTEQATGRKQFPVYITRYSIYWETAELATILVHELVGHGIQHLNGRLQMLDKFDKECEAHLYQERFYQDLGVDKRSGKVVVFRQTFHDRWCVPFRRYMEANMPTKVELWFTLNPDVPQLLSIFDKYLRAKYGP